jgi:hypothetical protein
MNAEQETHARLREIVLTEFGDDFRTSIVTTKTMANPSRFGRTVYLVVATLFATEKDCSETLADCDPEDISAMKKHLAEGDEVTLIFDGNGNELERLFRGMDYFFDYRKIAI